MDGGCALKLPVDAIAEFRSSPKVRHRNTAGRARATDEWLVTRSGGNQYHGSCMRIVRNDMFDARILLLGGRSNLSCRQNQFGGTAGGPIQRDRVQFLPATEGYRNGQGSTTSATVPHASGAAGRTFLRYGEAAAF